MENETLIYLGGNDIDLKHLGGTKYEISGSLILFGNDLKSSDFIGDWFGNDTDYDLRPDGTGEATLYYNHGKDPLIQKAKLGHGKARLTKREKDIWIQHELDFANQYDEMVIRLIQERKRLSGRNFGFSSGGVSHLSERKSMPDGSRKITRWTVSADASITLTPVDWRQTFVDSASLDMVSLKSVLNALDTDEALKSSGESSYNTNITYADDGKPIINISNTPNTVINSDDDTMSEAQSEGEEPIAATDVDSPIADDSNTKSKTTIPKVEVITMTEQVETPDNQDVQTTTPPVSSADFDNLKARIEAIETKNSEKLDAIMKFIETEPRINRSGMFTVDGGNADPNIKNVVDMLKAVQRGDMQRLKSVYNIKAQTESDSTAGGVWVGEQTLREMIPDLKLASNLGQLVRRIPVQQPSGEMPIKDYSVSITANAGNTASALGIESQARQEGGAYSEETIRFELLTYRVTDGASGLVKASRELTEDYPAIVALIRMAIQEDVVNKEEYFILRGTGAGQPLGVLNWVGTIDVQEATDNTFAVGDSDNMVSRLLRKNAGNVAWVENPSVYPSIASFERGTGGSVYQANIAGALPESLHGLPRLQSQHLPYKNTTNSGYVVLGDWSQYILFERGGLYIDFSEHADFNNGNNSWRFGKRFDGKPAMTSAVNFADGTHTESPFVAIQAG